MSSSRVLVRIGRAFRRVRTVVYISVQLILVLLGSLASVAFGPVGTAIGTSIIATGISGLIVFGWIFFTEEESDRRKTMESFGFVTAFPNRSIQIRPEYESRISKASHRIDVMGYGLNALREDFLGQFAGWAARVEVRIILVDPEFPAADVNYASLRDIEEHNQLGRTSSEIRRFVEDTRDLWSAPNVRFQIRLAKALPSVNMFRIDNESFWGPYLVASARRGRASRNLPTMIVRSPGFMYERLVDHFEEIWTNPDLSRLPS